ncbi:hypothetical protein P5V15_013223 [Pogonomyrmex californicus]
MEERSVHGSIGDINSAESTKAQRKKRICLVGTTCNDAMLNAAAQQFNVPVLMSETGMEYVEDTTYNTYFVLKQFEGPEYDVLCKSAHRVLGPTALLQLAAAEKKELPNIKRPMYTQAMVGKIVLFSGFRTREDELRKLANMVLNMGGSIRKEVGMKVTHLIANHCSGEKYRYADTYGLPIMSTEWVIALWNAKDDISSTACNEELITTYKLKPFYGAKVCFFGFPEEEKKHMCEVLEQQGGEATEIDDPNCTHVVVDVPDLFYERTNNVNFYLKNTSNRSPLSLINYKPESSFLSNPYSNATYNTMKDDSNVSGYFSLKNNSLDSYNIERNNQWNDLMSSISQDSVINMNDNCSDLQNSVIKSGSLFDSYTEQTDSGIDISRLSNLSSIFSMPNKNSILTMTSNKNVKFHVSESSLFDNENSISEITANLNKTNDLNSSSLYEKNNAYISPTNNNALSLRYRKNIHYIQNNTSKTSKIISKRYVKWRKTSSCTFVHKLATLEKKYKFMKTRSYPNISKHNEEQYNDTFLQNALSGKNKQLSQSHTSIFSKISHFSFCPTFYNNEQDISIDSCYSPPEKILSKKKYSSLSKFFPTPTKTLNTKHNLRNTSIFDGKDNNVLSTSNTKIECTDLKKDKPQDKSFVVVDESNVNVLPNLVSVSAFIVKTGWFWTSVQNEAAADEKEYLFEHYLETVLSPTATSRRDSQQIISQNVALAKHPCWLGGPLSNLLQNGADSPASVSGSFLDCTASPDKQFLDGISEVEAIDTENLPKIKENLSQRHKVFLELVETEANYVGILNTIMMLFKLPLENLIGSGRELLNSTEVKIIFGNFPPIYDVHKQLLEALRCSAAHWTEDISIGKIFLKFEPDLVKAYPPYVNFFENTKQMLEECDQNKPRFHAFLKNCQTIPECGRQSLKELLIKPIQRLPSISLLLSDILKHTDKSNPDYSALEASISCVKKVMTYINEDKRKTERQLAIFDIFNEIDNCPPHLVSSHRSFISKCDVMEFTEGGLSGRGDHLVLFLFTDTLEICKKRSKAFNSLKSPNTINGLQSIKLSQGKPYKHIKMLSLSTIRKVVDIRETDGCHKLFALVVRGTQELKEKFFSFIITDEEVNKTNYLQTLCRQMALTIRVADADTLLIRYDSHQLEVGTSDVASGTLKKTIKSLFHNFYLEYMDPFASRTRARVGRAFSFNKTPSKLNRAMSTIMSPFGATQNLPSTNQQIVQMRLGSCNNISELDNGGSSSPNREDVLVAPMSDQPTRKALSMASLRRL